MVCIVILQRALGTYNVLFAIFSRDKFELEELRRPSAKSLGFYTFGDTTIETGPLKTIISQFEQLYGQSSQISLPKLGLEQLWLTQGRLVLSSISRGRVWRDCRVMIYEFRYCFDSFVVGEIFW